MFLRRSSGKELITLIIMFLIILVGLAKVNFEFTRNVPEYDGIKVSANKEPLNIQVDFNDYVFYINKSILDNVKEEALQVFDTFKNINIFNDIYID